MKADEKNAASCLGMIIYAVIFTPLTMMLYGWTLATLWAWFVVPVFRLPALGVAYAIGITSVVRLLTYQGTADHPADDDTSAWGTLVEGTLKAVFLCLTFLAFGYAVKQFT